MENRFSRLVIISDCVHMHNETGNVVTENHIYCRQMQALAKYFDHTFIVCPFADYTKQSVVSAYSLSSINFIQLPNVGGDSIKDKFKLIKTIPAWLKAFRKASTEMDIVYLRMPDNLSIPGFFYFLFKKTKTFATYTGTWHHYKNEPATYRFQKWLLKNFFKGPVWIYVNEPPAGQKRLVKSISPSYNEAEWNEETEQVEERIKKYKTEGVIKPVFITVGALVPNKNQLYILETCKRLKENGLTFYWYIVGDGFMKSGYEAFVKKNDLESYVCIAGKKTYTELRALYRKANFLIQATLIEGFGKAPIEAMFHGVIPILSITAMANEMTGHGSRGFIFDPSKEDELEKVITEALSSYQNFNSMINDGRAYVKTQTLESWASDYIQQINFFYTNKK